MFCFFPNRSLLLRVLMAVKEGSPRKHTQSVQRPSWQLGPRPRGPFENSSGFTIKVKFQVAFFVMEKFATVKIRVWRFWTHFPIVLKWPSKNIFRWLIFVHVFTFTFRCSSKKLFCWLIFVHVFTLTISLKGSLFTCTIHLHYALTLNTYTMHYTLTQETLKEAEISFKRSYKLSFNLDTYIIHYASGDFLNWF